MPEELADERTPWVKSLLRTMVKEITRETILERNGAPRRPRLRRDPPVSCEVGVLPRAHGSALFTRGETQAMVTCTLGTSEDSQLIEAFEGESRQHFMLHYNFPPFSVGEVRFLRGPGRREIGHGALARRALEPLLPDTEAFPYTMRVVSDILESNGSSSMASVCGGSLALMDAGVPIKSAVAGVAMGLVSDGERFAVLTDIAGQEDHYGDMDFKVAGTRDGITALQMDIKISGLSREILEQALEQARRGRLQLLDTMDAGDLRAATGNLAVRAADLPDQDRRRPDPQRHRSRRQDHPLASSTPPAPDQRRGRRHRPDRHQRPRARPRGPSRSSAA